MFINIFRKKKSNRDEKEEGTKKFFRAFLFFRSARARLCLVRFILAG